MITGIQERNSLENGGEECLKEAKFENGHAGIDSKLSAEKADYNSDPTPLKNNNNNGKEKLFGDLLIKDIGYAWVVLGAMFVSNILTTGYVKGFGIVYNAILEVYPHASGTMAGIMMGLLSGCRSMFAPLAGSLANIIGIRKTMCLGASIYFIALLSSFFCSTVLQLSLTLGAMIGLSHCIIESCQVVVISQFFEKKLSVANGIRVAGNPCGGILYPLMLTVLLYTYGLRLLFVILAGVTTHIFICAFLMRPVHIHVKIKALDKVKRILQGNPGDEENGSTVQYKEHLFKKEVQKDDTQVNQSKIKGISFKYNKESSRIVEDSDKEKNLYTGETNVAFIYDDTVPRNNEVNSTVVNEVLGSDPKPTPIPLSEKPSAEKSFHLKSAQNDSVLEEKRDTWLRLQKGKITKKELYDAIVKENQDVCKGKEKKPLDVSFLKNPHYLLFIFMASGIPMGLPLVLYYMTIYAKNSVGLSPYEITILLSFQAVFDFSLRIFIGWLNNKNLYKKTHGFVFCLWCSAVGSMLMPLGKSLLPLLASVALYTFGPASYHTFVNVILTEEFGKEYIASTWGFVRMTQGIFSFIHPALIGYILDWTGSYTVPFLVMGTGMFFCGVIVTTESVFSRCINKGFQSS